MEGPDFPYPIQKNNSGLKWIILVSLAGFAILAGVLIFRKPQKIEAKKVVVITPVQYRQLSNTPTVKPIKIEDVTIQVLNGTGIPGQAALVVKKLEAAGYNLDNIKAGNAKTGGGTITTVTSRADFEGIAFNIKELLSSLFLEVKDGVPNTNPNEDSGFDVIITTGSSPTITDAQDPTVTPNSPDETPRPSTSTTTSP